MEKTFDFYFLSKDDRDIYLPQLFEILATNMNEIAPAGSEKFSKIRHLKIKLPI